MSSGVLSKKTPLLITSLVMLVMIGEYYLQIAGLPAFATTLRNWGILLSSFAICLGAGSLIIFHSNYIIKRTPERWWYGITCLGSMFIFIIVGVSLSPTSDQYHWIYTNIFSPMSMVVWGLPVFWLVSASFRAFTARTVESGIMLVVAIITLLAFAPVGELMYGAFPPFQTG